MNIGFAQKDSIFEGLHIYRSEKYPLSKVKTHLNKVLIWRDSLLKLENSIDTLSSLQPYYKFLSVNCKSMVFKEITYINALSWHFKSASDTELWLFEIHFDRKENYKRALFMMNRNMPKYELEDIGTSHYDWFMANENIYFVHLFYNEGPKSDIDYLEKASFLFKKKLK